MGRDSRRFLHKRNLRRDQARLIHSLVHGMQEALRALAFVMCIVPKVLCIDPTVIGISNRLHGFRAASRLSRCVSVTSRMGEDILSQNHNAFVYTPAHSPPNELKHRSLQKTAITLEDSADPPRMHLRMTSDRDLIPNGHKPQMYTQLQTQLYPQMQF